MLPLLELSLGLRVVGAGAWGSGIRMLNPKPKALHGLECRGGALAWRTCWACSVFSGNAEKKRIEGLGPSPRAPYEHSTCTRPHAETKRPTRTK